MNVSQVAISDGMGSHNWVKSVVETVDGKTVHTLVRRMLEWADAEQATLTEGGSFSFGEASACFALFNDSASGTAWVTLGGIVYAVDAGVPESVRLVAEVTGGSLEFDSETTAPKLRVTRRVLI